MRMRVHRTCVAVALAVAGAAWGQVTPADYARSEGLREAWMYLTKDVADPAQWIGNTSEFVYRKTVPGGFAFVVMDARTGEKRPAFDHARMAAGLGKAAGATYTALRLPFTDVQFSGDQSAITVRAADALWRCRVSDYVCAAMPAGRGASAWSGISQFPPTTRPNALPTAAGKPTSTTSMWWCAPPAAAR